MQQPPYGYPPQGHGGYAHPAHNVWTCPFCRYQGAPSSSNKITTAGWIIFAFMLLSCIGTLFCWLPLLITKRVTSCPHCRTVVGSE